MNRLVRVRICWYREKLYHRPEPESWEERDKSDKYLTAWFYLACHAEADYYIDNSKLQILLSDGHKRVPTFFFQARRKEVEINQLEQLKFYLSRINIHPKLFNKALYEVKIDENIRRFIENGT